MNECNDEADSANPAVEAAEALGWVARIAGATSDFECIGAEDTAGLGV